MSKTDTGNVLYVLSLLAPPELKKKVKKGKKLTSEEWESLQQSAINRVREAKASLPAEMRELKVVDDVLSGNISKATIDGLIKLIEKSIPGFREKFDETVKNSTKATTSGGAFISTDLWITWVLVAFSAIILTYGWKYAIKILKTGTAFGITLGSVGTIMNIVVTTLLVSFLIVGFKDTFSNPPHSSGTEPRHYRMPLFSREELIGDTTMDEFTKKIGDAIARAIQQLRPNRFSGKSVSSSGTGSSGTGMQGATHEALRVSEDAPTNVLQMEGGGELDNATCSLLMILAALMIVIVLMIFVWAIKSVNRRHHYGCLPPR